MGTRTQRTNKSFVLTHQGDKIPITAIYDRFRGDSWRLNYLKFDDRDQFHELNENDYNRLTEIIIEAQSVATEYLATLNEEQKSA